MEPKVDPDFQKLLPPLSSGELNELEASIRDEGIREPLVLWRGVLIDGHNRFDIAKKHGLPYRTTSLDFEDRAAARKWVIRNQLGRRNLTADWVSYLRGQEVKEAPREAGSRTDTSGKNVTRLQELAGEHGVDRRTLHRDAHFAEAVDTVAKAAGEDTRDTLLSGKLTREEVKRLSQIAEERPCDVRAAIMETSDKPPAEARKTEAWQNIHSSKSNEWYTPEEYIEAARRVLGSIDVDPASNEEAQTNVVRAETYYTEQEDGLAYDWRGTVWLNPPWGKEHPQFVERLLNQYARGNTTAAILLVNAHSTDTAWFQPLWNHILCFTDHRINFYGSEGSGSTHGSVFVYLGPDRKAFAEAFSKFGAVVERYHA